MASSAGGRRNVLHPRIFLSPRTDGERASFERVKRKTPIEYSSLDWNFAQATVLYSRLTPHLIRTWESYDGIFECHGLEHFLENGEDVYTEPCVEFFATYHFNQTTVDIWENSITFRLGGVDREMNLVAFAIATDIYTQGETEDPLFHDFLGAQDRVAPNDFNVDNFWFQISGVRVFSTNDSRNTMILDPIHRLLHRLLCNSLMPIKGIEKVARYQLWPLSCLINRSSINLPYVLAKSLADRGVSAYLQGGFVVTRLARYFQIGVNHLKATRGKVMDSRYLERMGIMERNHLVVGGYQVSNSLPRPPTIDHPPRQRGNPRYADRRQQQQQAPPPPQPVPHHVTLEDIYQQGQQTHQHLHHLGYYCDGLQDHLHNINERVSWLNLREGTMPPPMEEYRTWNSYRQQPLGHIVTPFSDSDGGDDGDDDDGEGEDEEDDDDSDE